MNLISRRYMANVEELAIQVRLAARLEHANTVVPVSAFKMGFTVAYYA
jgi:hypothetical protein